MSGEHRKGRELIAGEAFSPAKVQRPKVMREWMKAWNGG